MSTQRLFSVTTGIGAMFRAAAIVREERRLRRAVRHMPRPVTWDWAGPRILPLLAGPHLDQPGEEIVRAVADLGCALEFGILMSGVLVLVDRPVAERWECSGDQIHDVAMANLRRRAARLTPADVTRGTMSGRIVSQLRRTPPWASSLLLLPQELVRLFGPEDQIFGAPARDILVSFRIDTPPEVVADIVVDIETSQIYPLWLDPFILEHEIVRWAGTFVDDDAWA
ncbi:MAG TPA: hypothetical protein VNF73_16145 [Candidatus Saccharimonadales bacterium]|nr:hypothetical protein [Candidatus Saccharimonadales bacterium]